MKPNKNPILEALQVLHAKYPQEQVDIWVRQKGDSVIFNASVEGKYGSGQFSDWGTTALEAVQSLFERAGERSQPKMREQEIAELRQRLLKLEEENRAV